MCKTLYVSDLDGTLLNGSGVLSPYTLSVLNRLLSQGLPFTYATARSFSSASAVTRGLQLKLPALVYNGGAIADTTTGALIETALFSLSDIQMLVEWCCRFSLSPFVYAFLSGRETVSYLSGRVNPGMRHYLCSRPGDRRFRPLDEPNRLFEGDVFHITCIGDYAQLVPLAEAANQCSGLYCTFAQELYREEYWCELMPAVANKGDGIQKLKRSLHCEQVAVFGDQLNDLAMFQYADKRYAVANAVDALKAAADAVIGGNEEDGVARFLAEKKRLL